MRNRTPLTFAAFAAFASIAFPSPPTVSADSSVPAPAAFDRRVAPWGDYCFARFQRAREELGRSHPRFAAGKVVHGDGAVHFIFALKDTSPSLLYHARVGGAIGLDISQTIWADSDGWQREAGTDGALRRRMNGHEARLGAADPEGVDASFLSVFRRAADDCLAAGGVSAKAPRSFAGTWRFDGGIRFDGCAGALELRIGEFTVSSDERILHSVRLGRDYHVHVENGLLIAENTFPDPSCPDRTFHERWVLAPTGDHTAAGGLDTTWNRQPMCGKPCDVDFYISATRDPAR